MLSKSILILIVGLTGSVWSDRWGHHHHEHTKPPKHGCNSHGETKPGSTQEETKSLEQLYAEAKKEGCSAIVYAGGDTPGQLDYYKGEFEKRFPNCTLEIIVDYSKFHGPRIDYQIQNKGLIPDVVQLQTLQDFPRWKKRDLLLSYKPRGWSVISNDYKDFDGAFVGIFFGIFTNCVNKNLLRDEKNWPREINDFLRPGLTLTSAYPNDDDAILYLFKRFADKYGWGYLEKLHATGNMRWVRGTQEPFDAVDEGRSMASPAAGCDMFNRPSSASVLYLPKNDPFMTWAQTAAIFKNTKKPATAKLYLNWILDKDTQSNHLFGWSIRSDVAPPPKFGPLSSYKNQTDPVDFKRFMEDRALVEELKTTVGLIIGEVQGPPSPGILRLYPTKALPH